MLNIFKKFFDFNEKQLSGLQKRVDEINALEDRAHKLKVEDFKKETKKLKEQVQKDGKTLDEILPWAYALTREASRRVNGQRHFDVQLMGGVALHEGKIIEQKTGEGKTLTATTSLYLNALKGEGVHLVTVNDYLARRDAGWMGSVFHFLGMTTAAIIGETSFIYDSSFDDKEAQDWRLAHLRPITRKEAYATDVTYGINSEFGFDYLRDNMATSRDQLVQRGFYYAIIDEADSVLIDEARTPHIISAPYDQDTSKYYDYVKVVKRLDPKTDYVIDEKLRTANLTEAGIQNVETAIGVHNIYEKDFDTLFHIEAALKAETLFKNDKEYIVKDGEVIIVDEFTGRLLQGRRFSEGLHQAIEAKEQVAIQKESKTLATVSLQNYFRMYEKLAGMTGTAATEAEEFHKIYKADVVVIPTHRKMGRADYPDMIYKTENGKFNAVVDDIVKSYKSGRPVLVGTTSIQKNEYLSKLLNDKGIPHELLNAKNHEGEARIIADAGKKHAVTVATNMAGRGVDIILGGATPNTDSLKDAKGKVSAADEKKIDKELQKWQKEHDEVVSVGGLYVIGTERHESRRIDNQLRGRSGRQGDPGETRFFVALEDDLMRIFGGDQISKLMTFFNFPEDQPLSHSMVSKAIEQAQVKVEGFNFDIRKHLVEFDDVLNKQREIIYSLRRKMLILPEENPEEFEDELFAIFKEEIAVLTNSYIAISSELSEKDTETFKKDLFFVPPKELHEVDGLIKRGDTEHLNKFLEDQMEKGFEMRKKKVGQDVWFDISRILILSTIDQFWTQHLTAIEDLREGINLRGYAQMDPLIEYKNEAFKLFERLVSDIYFESTRRLFLTEVQVGEPQKEKQEKAMVFQSASSIDPFKVSQKEANNTGEIVARVSNAPTQGVLPLSSPSSSPNPKRKIGRNDPCWCGSGKKYKKCHYPN